MEKSEVRLYCPIPYGAILLKYIEDSGQVLKSRDQVKTQSAWYCLIACDVFCIKGHCPG